jgi:hypothetical protein
LLAQAENEVGGFDALLPRRRRPESTRHAVIADCPPRIALSRAVRVASGLGFAFVTSKFSSFQFAKTRLQEPGQGSDYRVSQCGASSRSRILAVSSSNENGLLICRFLRRGVPDE